MYINQLCRYLVIIGMSIHAMEQLPTDIAQEVIANMPCSNIWQMSDDIRALRTTSRTMRSKFSVSLDFLVKTITTSCSLDPLLSLLVIGTKEAEQKFYKQFKEVKDTKKKATELLKQLIEWIDISDRSIAVYNKLIMLGAAIPQNEEIVIPEGKSIILIGQISGPLRSINALVAEQVGKWYREKPLIRIDGWQRLSDNKIILSGTSYAVDDERRLKNMLWAFEVNLKKIQDLLLIFKREVPSQRSAHIFKQKHSGSYVIIAAADRDDLDFNPAKPNYGYVTLVSQAGEYLGSKKVAKPTMW